MWVKNIKGNQLGRKLYESIRLKKTQTKIFSWCWLNLLRNIFSLPLFLAEAQKTGKNAIIDYIFL